VVEDDEIQREMLVLSLEESAFDVIQCDDAETASHAATSGSANGRPEINFIFGAPVTTSRGYSLVKLAEPRLELRRPSAVTVI
jgi:hypothetical protein